MTQICFGHRAHPVASGPSVRVALTLRPVLTLEAYSAAFARPKGVFPLEFPLKYGYWCGNYIYLLFTLFSINLPVSPLKQDIKAL